MYSHIYLTILLVVLSCRLSFTSTQFRMKNGREIEIKDSPHTVAIFYYTKFACVGSLVNLNTVVTSAHPVYDKKESGLEVLAGEADVCKFGNGNVQQLKVQSVILGDGYTERSYYMDIAVVKLAGYFTSGVTVKPVTICDFELKPDMKMKVSGWGTVALKSGAAKIILEIIEMLTMRKDECQRYHSNTTPATSLSETIFCGRPRGSNTEGGDFGAGAIVKEKLCGVLSGGCDDLTGPPVFTDLTNNKVIDFLRRNIVD